MAKNKKKNKVKNKIILSLFFIAMFVIITMVIYAVINLVIEPTNIFVVKKGNVYCEENAEGYVIRDEIIIQNENAEKEIVQIKTEGEKVAKGETIFRYKMDEEETTNNKIQEVNKQIQEALEGQKGLFSSDIKALESQIEGTLKNIDEKNNIQEIKERKNDISKYITKKAKIAGNLSNAGEYIKSLIEQKENLENNLYSEANYVGAIESGILSYRIDGLEDVLITEDFSYINLNFLKNLNLKTGQIINTTTNTGKIVNNYKCYIATILESEEAKNAEVGDTIYIRLSNKKEVKAKITYIDNEKDNIVVIFEINNGVEDLIEYRKISIDVIWWKDEGLKIPKNSIYYDNSLAYVIRNTDGRLNKILIKILEENDEYCIVDNYEVNDLKDMGFSTEEIKDSKKISIYDEIVLNPDITKVQ